MGTETSTPQKGFFALLFGIILRPRLEMETIRDQGGRGWIIIALFIIILTVLPTLVSATIVARQFEDGPSISASVERGDGPSFSASVETEETQGEGVEVLQVIASPMITIVIPLVGVVFGTVINWLIWAGALHLGGMMLGGRNTFRQVFRVVIWSWLPFALRSLVQTIFILTTGELITNPGLSGLVTDNRSITNIMTAPPAPSLLVLASLLGRLDIWLVWNLVLLIIGVTITARFNNRKAIVLTLVVWLILAALSLLPVLATGFLATSIS